MITSLHSVKVHQLQATQNTFETFKTTNASYELRFLPLLSTHFFPFSLISGFSLRAQTGHFRSWELKKAGFVWTQREIHLSTPRRTTPRLIGKL